MPHKPLIISIHFCKYFDSWGIYPYSGLSHQRKEAIKVFKQLLDKLEKNVKEIQPEKTKQGRS